VLRQT